MNDMIWLINRITSRLHVENKVWGGADKSNKTGSESTGVQERDGGGLGQDGIAHMERRSQIAKPQREY